ncbi:MAG: uncharacterized protein QG559_576 [Campylobacterota bacterium]|nr:uncharacterized protein [Campylobacterota bacterium]
MEILLEELYKNDIVADKFHFRKLSLDEDSYQIVGVSQSGKTKLIKNYLLSLKKSTYLYIDCSDIRIEHDTFNKSLQAFCTKNKIFTLVLDNYSPNIYIVNVPQIIICSQIEHKIDFLKTIYLYPLSYEEFLAYEHKYDSSALNHFFQLGGFANMHNINSDERVLYVQKTLKYALDEMELDILIYCTKMMTQKISPFSIYERLKNLRKISKDKLYKSFEALDAKNYIHQLQKVNHPKAIRKIYLCDISLKSALSIDKHFGRVFENMIYLELLKAQRECYYDDGVDFYIPKGDEIILAAPFADERALFKKIEAIESFIVLHQIKKISVVTMSKEGSINHPFSQIEMVPFDIWALGD